jgi:hypothetical protein
MVNLFNKKRATQKLNQTLTKVSFFTGFESRGSITSRPIESL